MNHPATQLAQRLQALEAGVIPDVERARFDTIRAAIPGWSDLRHWVFFRELAAVLPPTASILILGVYHGMDIALARAAGLRDQFIIGVDKFNDQPCADWPRHWSEAKCRASPSSSRSGEELRDEPKAPSLWQAVGVGPAPDYTTTRNLLRAHDAHDHLNLVQMDDAQFLAQCPLKFDLVYLDTAHDRATVARQIRQVQDCHLLSDKGILAGDDYDNLEPTWGVRDAVTAAFPTHYVLAHRIWWVGRANGECRMENAELGAARR